MPDSLRIYLLGGLRLERGDFVTTRFRSRRTASLLAYLAYHKGIAIPREVLIDQFWEEFPYANAKNSLNTAISSLRRQLGVIAALPESIIQVDRQSVKLNGDFVWTDVAAFKIASSIALQPNPGQPASLDEALGLYKGELLYGLYDSWIASEAFELSELHQALLDLAVYPGIVERVTYSKPMDNLPRMLGPFVGRRAELARLAEQHMEHALVSIVGPGGVGKTRTAIELGKLLAARGEPVWFVSFGGSPPTEAIVEEAARQLGMRSSADPMIWLEQHLGDVPNTLILDNLEHLEDVAVKVLGLMSRLRRTHVISTTRTRLSIDGERVFNLDPLPVPGARADLDELRTNASASLFVNHAASFAPSFSLNNQNAGAVRELCQLLGGNSLMIELAAARIQVYGVREMVAAMDRPLDFLVSRSSDRSGRHRSARGTVDWSLSLLSRQAREAFARLSISRDGWTLGSATAVIEHRPAAEVLHELIDASLLVSSARSEARHFSMHPVIREAAFSALHPKEVGRTQALRLDYFGKLADAGRRQMTAHDEKNWLDSVDHDFGNLRECLEWAWSHEGGGPASDIATNLLALWIRRGHFRDGMTWLELAASFEDQPPEKRAGALLAAGRMNCVTSDWNSAERYFKLADETYAQLSDAKGISKARANLGILDLVKRDLAAAEKHFAEAVFGLREAQIQPDCELLFSYAQVEFALNRVEFGEALCQEALALDDGDKCEKRRRVQSFHADRSLLSGDISKAERLYRDLVASYRDLDDSLSSALALNGLAQTYYRSGRLKEAAQEFGEVLRTAEEMGDERLIAHMQVHLGKALVLSSDRDKGEELIRQANSSLTKLSDPGMCSHTAAILLILNYRDQSAETLDLCATSLESLLGDRESIEFNELLVGLSLLANDRGFRAEADKLLAVAARYFQARRLVPDPLLSGWIQSGDTEIEPGDPILLAKATLELLRGC